MKKLITLILLGMPLSSYAYDSGSTGVDGVFNPTADIELQLTPSGIFNFTTVNIPADVTVTFAKNAQNTPVTLLVIGDVNIAGSININGANTARTSDADVTGDGLPGIGGPGGFDGGHGGYSGPDNDGGHGQGPGAGDSGRSILSNRGCGGAGAGYNGNGINFASNCSHKPKGGSAYGIDALMPLLGGSGGGGGAGISTIFGSGGGGGGGAILIASSGTLSISGIISANGGATGNTDGSGSLCSGSGGGGSGGAIRIIATTLTGVGTISARAGRGPVSNSSFANHCNGTSGAPGRIRLETETMQFTAQTSPPFSFAGPSPIFVPNLPGITFTSIAGIVAPGTPTGSNDIVLPENTANPVEIVLASSGIPSGSIIKVTATGLTGPAVSVDSTAIASDGSATVSINLPGGPSTLIASTTFLVTASLGSEYSTYAKGEQVEKVRVGMNAEGQSETTFITATGKEYTWLSNTVAMN